MVRSERGQLILVGAIAIALILLGLVLIVNTALFTQVVGSEGTVESAKEGGVSGQEIGNGISAVIAEENLRGGSASDINDDVNDSVSDHLQQALANRSVEGSGAFVSAQYINSAEKGRILQQTSGDIEEWQPVPGEEVGQFNMTIDTNQSTGGDFNIASDPATGSERNVTVEVNGAGDAVTLSTDTGTICSGVAATNGNVRINVRHGIVYESSACQFDQFPDTNDVYHVNFTDVNNVEASYTIVTTNTTILDTSVPDTPLTSSSAVWSFEYGFTYESTDATVESDSRVIDVYD